MSHDLNNLEHWTQQDNNHVENLLFIIAYLLTCHQRAAM
jgi:hypothetical protein